MIADVEIQIIHFEDDFIPILITSAIRILLQD